MSKGCGAHGPSHLRAAQWKPGAERRRIFEEERGRRKGSCPSRRRAARAREEGETKGAMRKAKGGKEREREGEEESGTGRVE